MEIKEAVKKKRVERNLSLRQLGEMVGISGSMIGQIERGTKVPTAELLNEIAHALGCSALELVPELGKK